MATDRDTFFTRRKGSEALQHIEEMNSVLPFNEWLDSLPSGDESALFEDSLAARYPLIDRECPFDD